MKKILMPLCNSCLKSPWGEKGYADFHSHHSQLRFPHVFFLAGSEVPPTHTISYKISSRWFIEQAAYCFWCQLLYKPFETHRKSDDRDSLSTKEYIDGGQKRVLGFEIQFLSAPDMLPKRITKLRIIYNQKVFVELDVLAFRGKRSHISTY